MARTRGLMCLSSIGPRRTRSNPLTPMRVDLVKAVIIAAVLNGALAITLTLVILRRTHGVPLLAPRITQARL